MDFGNAGLPFKRKATEPSKYANMTKICKRCKKSNVIFKFLNNKKEDQPRYQCRDCTLELNKPYLFNPFPIREHNHEHGYAKLPKRETVELQNLIKVCDHCQAENNATFRGYNNGKITQPRYACKACKRMFSPMKSSKAASTFSNGIQTPTTQYQDIEAPQQMQTSNLDVPSNEFQNAQVQCQEMGAWQQPNNMRVPFDGFQNAQAPYQEMGAWQQQQTYYQEMGDLQQQQMPNQEMCAWQQPSNLEESSCEFQTTEASYQGMEAWQQQQTYYQEMGAWQQQMCNQEMGAWQQQQMPNQQMEALQPPHLCSTLYEQTPMVTQPDNSYNTFTQSNSQSHSLTSMDIAGPSDQFPYQAQTAAQTWQYQQPPSYNQTPTWTSQQHGQHYNNNKNNNPRSDNDSLENVGVSYGSSSQFPSALRGVEARRQRTPLYDPSCQQTSNAQQQQLLRFQHLQSQSTDNYPYSIDKTVTEY